MDVIWKAVELSKSDFEILQVEWFDRRTSEENKIADEYIKNKPEKIKFIPMIRWDEIPNYYIWADAVMSQMRFRHGSIEREAVLCGTPVLNYNDNNETYLINNEECNAKFLPNSKNPQELALIIDKIVTDEKFRNKLLEDELEFVKRLTDSNVIGMIWDKMFEEIHEKISNVNRKNSFIKSKFLNFMTKILENLIYKKRWRYKQE